MIITKTQGDLSILFDTQSRERTSDWWSGAYLKGLTSPRDLRQRGAWEEEKEDT
jgi:hypothetical protein